MYKKLFGIGGKILNQVYKKVTAPPRPTPMPRPQSVINKQKSTQVTKPTQQKPIQKKPESEKTQVTFKDDFLIIANPSATLETVLKWATNKNSNFKHILPIAYSTSVKYGIDPILTIAQIALETGYCTYTGQVPSSYHNTCGLKTRDGKSFHKFNSWEEGIEAHIQHLALYANSPKLNGKVIIDPRHFEWLRGTAKSANGLAEKWAYNLDYGKKLNKLCNDIIKNQ